MSLQAAPVRIGLVRRLFDNSEDLVASLAAVDFPYAESALLLLQIVKLFVARTLARLGANPAKSSTY
jgi:hypothetical protein